MLRFILADDHSVVRAGLKQILLQEFPGSQIDEVPDAEELIKKVIKNEYDIVISDMAMPGRSGLEALEQIKQIHPKLPVLILSFYPELQYAVRVLKSGASGYLNKDMAPSELVNAVHRVLLGKKYISPAVAERLASSFANDDEQLSYEHLSNREFEVMKLLAAGKSVTEISELYSLSITTVSTYRSRVMLKMGMKTNADLTKYAIENNLI